MNDAKISPGFLVAAPQLQDPHFADSVVLMLEHDDEEGALGLIINRPAAVRLETVLEEMKISMPDPMALKNHPPLLYGGPVSPERGWILHTPDWSGAGTRAVDEGLSVTASRDILESIAENNGPDRYRFCLGYAGWGPHQLIEEIKTGAWITVPFDVALVFDTPLPDIWSAALMRLGINPANLAAQTGDA